MPMMTATKIHDYTDTLITAAAAAETLAGQAGHDGLTDDVLRLSEESAYLRAAAERWRNVANERGVEPTEEEIAGVSPDE